MVLFRAYTGLPTKKSLTFQKGLQQICEELFFKNGSLDQKGRTLGLTNDSWRTLKFKKGSLEANGVCVFVFSL